MSLLRQLTTSHDRPEMDREMNLHLRKECYRNESTENRVVTTRTLANKDQKDTGHALGTPTAAWKLGKAAEELACLSFGITKAPNARQS